ncbi:MAG: AAA family ATPase, partial [Magnetococcales bacterium]|nr:AAA family ATPase [Magnetococcales bacterium]
MLRRVTIKNFRSIKECSISLTEDLHILVGPNGSGKSTFLDAIQFVRDCLEFGPGK